MALFKKVDKVLASLGNIRAMERLHVDTFTEDIINNIEGDVLAQSEEGIIYAGIDELNGYLFLETAIVSGLKIKTFNGATLSFTGEEDFKLVSDTQEIESDFSNVSNRYMCKISFNITENETKFIQEKKYEKVVFECKKKSLTVFRKEY